jgi:hypothetical protein
MRLQVHRDPGLPRLAWFLKIEPDQHAELWHGPWVETWPTGFAAGIWEGRFGQDHPDQAMALVGSAGRVDDDRLILAAPTDADLYLTAAKWQGSLCWSNSLACLLARTGDALDVQQPYYIAQFLRFYRLGQRRLSMRLPTRDREVQLYKLCNVIVDPTLQVQAVRKPLSLFPKDFRTHKSYLLETMAAVFENAADPARAHPYPDQIACISRGYDSAAVAALGSELGVNQGLTFHEVDGQGRIDRSDDGTEIGQILGYQVHSLPRYGYRDLPGLAEIEFCSSFENGMMAPIAAAESLVEGKILLRGDWGDRVWSLTPYANAPDWLLPERFNADSGSHIDFSLRTGCLFFPVPKLAMDHVQQLHNISASAEMQPWSVPGSYNRPIPRRMLESAGVPRQAFGQSKMATGHLDLHVPEGVRPAVIVALKRFMHQQQVAHKAAGRPRWTLGRTAGLIFGDRLYSLIYWLRPPELQLWLRPLIFMMLRFQRLWRDTDRRGRQVYLFHLAVEGLKSRYAQPDSD